MTVDKWEELWSREIPESEFDRWVNTDWLREVKAEGDALKEKLNELKDWERIAREQADTLLLQHANIKRVEKFVEDARETVRQGLLQADAPLWFLRSLQRDLGVEE